MISRSRSAPTAAAMSIECTTSANSTVTCLYSADRVACVSGAPHSLQNLEFGGSSVPHDPQSSPVAVSPPPPSPLGSTSVSFHRWSTMSVISPCHIRHEVLRLSYVVRFETSGTAEQIRSIGTTSHFRSPADHARKHHRHGRLRDSGLETSPARQGDPGRPRCSRCRAIPSRATADGSCWW